MVNPDDRTWSPGLFVFNPHQYPFVACHGSFARVGLRWRAGHQTRALSCGLLTDPNHRLVERIKHDTPLACILVP